MYEEAREIVAISPRAAAALLRLCLQMLCGQVGEKGDNLHTDIKSLLDKGKIDKSLQKAFDSVRVIGNNAVHPGVIDIDERKEDVHLLFRLINIIATKMITDENKITALYSDLPENQKRKAQS